MLTKAPNSLAEFIPFLSSFRAKAYGTSPNPLPAPSLSSFRALCLRPSSTQRTLPAQQWEILKFATDQMDLLLLPRLASKQLALTLVWIFNSRWFVSAILLVWGRFWFKHSLKLWDLKRLSWRHLLASPCKNFFRWRWDWSSSIIF